MASGVAFDAAVLAGGESRRMGFDKALYELNGVALLDRVAQAARTAGAHELSVVRTDLLPESDAFDQVLADAYPRQGPLGALITALRHHRERPLLILSCDLLAPSPTVMAEMVSRLDPHDGVIADVGGHIQWLHSVWSPACLPALEAAFEAGTRAVRDGVHALDLVTISSDDASAFANANVPGDLR